MKQGWKLHSRSRRTSPAPLTIAARYRIDGVRSLEEGNAGQAVLSFCRAIELEPRDAPTLRQLGSALLGLGHCADAERTIEQSLRLNPGSPETWFELGNAFHLGGKLDEAAWAYTQSLQLEPGHARAHYNLGVTRLLQKRTEEALECFSAAVRADPSDADAQNNRGILQHLSGDLDASIESYRSALRSQPGDMRAAYNLGVALQSAGRLEEAEQAYLRVLRAGELNSSAHNNLGNVLMALGRVGEAISHYKRARLHDASSPEAPWNLGVAHLLTGDYTRGWEGHEYRMAQPGFDGRHFEQPRWTGEGLEGRRILLHAEQGLGDTIQFSRFAPVLSGQGATVFLECQPTAVKLLESVPGIALAIPRATDQPFANLPDFDYHSPLMSVPGVLRTTLDTLPAEVPYLFPRPSAVGRWASTIDGLAPARPRRRVGLTWAGNPHHRNDANRSLPFSHLAPLLELSGMCFFSLQKGEAAAQLGDADRRRLFDLEPLLTDLEQTAAAILQLDLVISVDTVVAHVAGALGRPVWLLLPFAPDWRWMLERGDSPWYPSMRIFRQPVRGDWNSVVETVCRALLESAAAVDP